MASITQPYIYIYRYKYRYDLLVEDGGGGRGEQEGQADGGRDVVRVVVRQRLGRVGHVHGQVQARTRRPGGHTV